MLDGVQARLLLQASGLLIMPVSLEWLTHAVFEAIGDIHRVSLLHSWPYSSITAQARVSAWEEVAFSSTWCILTALMLVIGGRLFFCRGFVFPMLVRSLAQ